MKDKPFDFFNMMLGCMIGFGIMQLSEGLGLSPQLDSHNSIIAGITTLGIATLAALHHLGSHFYWNDS